MRSVHVKPCQWVVRRQMIYTQKRHRVAEVELERGHCDSAMIIGAVHTAASGCSHQPLSLLTAVFATSNVPMSQSHIDQSFNKCPEWSSRSWPLMHIEMEADRKHRALRQPNPQHVSLLRHGTAWHCTTP